MTLRAKQSKKFKATTNSKHDKPIAPNTLDRNFEVQGPNKVWVSDITYVWTEEGWLYLVVFIDLWSRKIVGWSMSDRMKSEFVQDAFQMACRKRKPQLRELLVHSDRGSDFSEGLAAVRVYRKMTPAQMDRIRDENAHLEREQKEATDEKALF